MFIFGNFFTALAIIVDFVLTLYMWIIVIRALISWVNPDPYNPIVIFLYKITEPVLYPIRRYFRLGMIDISPIIVIIIIIFLQNFLVPTLKRFALQLM